MFSKLKPKRPLLRHSIRSRLALWYGGILGAVFIFLGFLLYVNLAQNLHSDFDRSLRLTAEALVRFSSEGPPLSELSADDFLDEINDPEFLSKFFRFLGPDGVVRLSSRNYPKRTIPLTPRALDNALRGKTTFETFSYPGRDAIRIVTYPALQEGKASGALQVGGSLLHVEAVLRRLRFILLLTLPTALLLALAGGWFLAHKALQPVDAMAQAARRITAGDLSRRIPVHQGQDELSRLAETFNVMIGQLEDSIQRLRQFSADASHELRTPLTILKGETELALRQARSVEEYQETLVSALEEIDRISRIVEDLFLLSKADLGEARLEMKPVSLALLIKETVSQMEILAQEKKMTLRFERPGAERPIERPEAERLIERRAEPMIWGDPYRLRELLLNFIENAIQYTPAEGSIVLSLSSEGETVLLTIADTGVGISKDDLPKIFDRFYRADDARAMHPKGSGLGLSICRWIVQTHRGTIDVQSEPGRGTTFTLRFPLLH